jgi:uncharacterized protein (TIGR02328 family)
MRLWHEDLLPELPKQWLQGQHRECCALRGKGWGKKHATVDYVFRHPYADLYRYHREVISLLIVIGVKVDQKWLNPAYRGKRIGWDSSNFTAGCGKGKRYPEHDGEYYRECVRNLKEKGVGVG